MCCLGKACQLFWNLWRHSHFKVTFFNQIYSFFLFQTGSRWQHITNRCVVLESSHLLMLHEFERIALQKIALQKLNNSDLGVTTRIPKGEPALAYSRNAL